MFIKKGLSNAKKSNVSHIERQIDCQKKIKHFSSRQTHKSLELLRDHFMLDSFKYAELNFFHMILILLRYLITELYRFWTTKNFLSVFSRKNCK